MWRYILAIPLFLLFFSPVLAQEVHQDLKETVHAEVLSIISESERDIVGTDTKALIQEVRARILSGEKEGTIVTFESDLTRLEVGDSIYLNRLEGIDGSEYYLFKDFDRRMALTLLGVLFLVVLVSIAGTQGLRAFGSLLVSIALIIFVLVPLLLNGYDPVWSSSLVAGGILAIALFATHGVTSRATVAFLGTLGAVLITGLLATFWVSVSQLTGFSSDASIYLNFSTRGALDFSGLLLGAIIIGTLGVLDDVAITQTSVVGELSDANKTLSPFELYRRALRVGRDHIGSLVNTLALAYAGVSLPLILLFARTDSTFLQIINQEVVAAELVRTLVGSIGLILTVPITTGIAVWWVKRFGTLGEVTESHHHH